MSLQMPTALILDDDPSHLKIYSWIVERAGYKCLTVLVRNSSVELPPSQDLDVIIMDYRYSSSLTAADILQTVRVAFPGAAVIVLSELFDLPADMSDHATAFVRKGDPQQLVNKLNELKETGQIREFY
jgi:Response regulator containing CheY-like receiver, AAA-type ATPase, and DNA-binding domains